MMTGKRKPAWYYEGLGIAKRNAEAAGIPLSVYLDKITRDLQQSMKRDEELRNNETNSLG